MKKRTLFFLLIPAVLLFGACRNRTAERQEHTSLADARVALLKERFPDMKIITTQEQRDSVIRAIIANDTTEFKISTHFIYASQYQDKNQYDEAEAEYRYIMKYGNKEESHEAQESLSRMYYGRGMYRESLALLPDSLSIEGISMEAAAVRALTDQSDRTLLPNR